MRRYVCWLILFSLVLSGCANQTSVQEENTPVLSWQEQYDLGLRYLSEGNYEEAIIAFTAAIEIDPKRAPAYAGRGDAYVLSGETEENLTAAQADYEKAIELDESTIEAYLKLANIYESSREQELVHIPDREPRLHGVLAPPCRKGAPLFHEQF